MQVETIELDILSFRGDVYESVRPHFFTTAMHSSSTRSRADPTPSGCGTTATKNAVRHGRDAQLVRQQDLSHEDPHHES